MNQCPCLQDSLCRRCAKVLAVLIIFLSTISVTESHAAAIPELPALGDGSYPVGFTTIERFDHSRTIRPAYDYFGEPLEGETARPIQIAIWYPADSTEGQEHLLFGEYTFPYPSNSRFFDFLSLLQDREIGRLQSVLRGDQGLVLDLLSVRVNTIANPPHADGLFPLVVYCGERGTGFVDNLALFEYLASHGFVVTAVHSVGAAGITPSISSQDLEALARDIEFVIATMRDFPTADVSRLAVTGRGFGGLAGLVAATRHSSIKAAITFGALLPTDVHMALIDGHPTFSPARLAIPLMQVVAGNMGPLDQQLSAELSRTERTMVSDSTLSPLSVSYWGVLSTLRADAGTDTSPLLGQYQAICRYVHEFLNWRLLDEQETKSSLVASLENPLADASGITVATHAAEPAPPTGEQFMQIIRERGVAKAQEICDRFGLPRPEQPVLEEYSFNALGYGYLQRGSASDAVIVLRWATMAYPTSANAWDSYADACLQTGNPEEALRSLRMSLEVLPNDTTTDERTKSYIRENTPTRIRELEDGG